MTKVHTCAGPTEERGSPDSATTRPSPPYETAYHRLSVAINVLLTLSLVSTPLMAYTTEPFPWTIPTRDNFTWTSFDTYTDVATTTLRAVYNNHTMGPDVVCTRSINTNTHAVRYFLTFPPAEDLVDRPFRQFTALVSFPGSLFYGAGLRALVYDFLAANDTMRLTDGRWQRCQHVRLFGQAVAEACTWIEPPAAPRDPVPLYTVYHGVVILETIDWSWIKFVYRTLLAGYIMWIMWNQYYRHVRALHKQLQVLGLDGWPRCTTFHVLVGDPTPLVVSDPVVAMVMVIDIFVSPAYLSMAAVRVGQFNDLVVFVLGCIYSSRNVWCGFLTMQLLTVLIKRWGKEASFSPVNPDLLTIAAYCYGGPVVALCATTPVMIVFHVAWGLFVPSAEGQQAIESVTGLIAVSTMLASLPIMYSHSHVRLRRTIQRARTSLTASMWKSVGAITPTTNSYVNNAKHRFLVRALGIGSKYQVGVAMEYHGGVLHDLFDKSARYRTKPLFSLVDVDVFVFSEIPDGKTDKRRMLQLRLSLLSALDQQSHHAPLAIPRCPKKHESSAVCTMRDFDCSDTNAANKLACLHSGATPWL